MPGRVSIADLELHDISANLDEAPGIHLIGLIIIGNTTFNVAAWAVERAEPNEPDLRLVSSTMSEELEALYTVAGEEFGQFQTIQVLGLPYENYVLAITPSREP